MTVLVWTILPTRDAHSHSLARGADGSKVGNNLLGVLSLASSRLSSDEDGLVVTRLQKRPEYV